MTGDLMTVLMQVHDRSSVNASPVIGPFVQDAVEPENGMKALIARSAHPGVMQAWVFVVFAAILVLLVPLVRLVPEHHGGW